MAEKELKDMHLGELVTNMIQLTIKYNDSFSKTVKSEIKNPNDFRHRDTACERLTKDYKHEYALYFNELNAREKKYEGK
jgi:hypothetical protein